MSDLPQGRRPARRPTRPLLLAGAGVALVKITAGCLVSGNLMAPPPCDDPDAGMQDHPWCQDDFDAGFDGEDSDAGTTDGGTEDAGQ
ncbi:MAG: hypothetical protein WBV82_00370 [Myxococcaceae bacterium]